jgi:AcrR family transcriptional regulator
MNTVNSNKKEIQEERMKRYFIDAAKELIKGEGLDVVSVRNVAERAGYSYATLYNYFKDLRDLIYCCLEDFRKECASSIAAATSAAAPGRDRIIAIAKAYAKFFIQYPGIYDVMFFSKSGRISTNKAQTETFYTFFDDLSAKAWKECIDSKLIGKSKAAAAAQSVKLSLHGLLMFYLARRHDAQYGSIMDEIEIMFTQWLKEPAASK